jgi:MOSC domain-containing protein YiiM
MGRSLALSSSDELKSGENLLVDPIPSLTIHRGYRYEWGDVLAPLAFIGQPTPPSGPFETANSTETRLWPA